MASLICDLKYAQRSSPVSVSDEEHSIKTSVPYSITLKEKPSEDYDITIPGYTESTSAPTSETEFYVDYDLAIVYFYLNKAGEDITVSYYGTGSPIVADDLNRFSILLGNSKPSIFSFRLGAFSGSVVRLYGGTFVTGTTVHTKKELLLNFGPSGNFAVSLSEGYFKKILIGIDTTLSEIAMAEGTEVAKYEATRIPSSYASDFSPIGIVTVGSNFDISQSDIIPVRNFLL